jgi:hypothetical protein
MISRQGLLFRFVTRLAIFGLCAVALVACGSSSEDEVSGITEPQSEVADQSKLNGSSDSESSETVEEEPAEVVEEESAEVVEEESAEVVEEESAEVVEEESVEPETVEVEADPQIEEETSETDEGMTSEEQEALIESILLDSYLWGSGTAFKTIQLQEVLELNVDGTYGPQTRVAHLLALEERGLPTANVPEEPSGATPPSQPTTLLVAPGDSLAKLTWTGSEESGGIPLVGYTATATPGGQKCETTGTSCDITGLTNGTSYTFVVTASNGEFISDESSTVAVTPGIPNSVFNNLDNCTESEDYCSSGGIKIDWSANQGLGSNDAYSYYNHLITYYYDIRGGDGHGGIAWKDNRNVEIIDVTHDGTCVQLTEFYLRVENERLEGSWEEEEIDELTIELVSAILYLYKDGVLIGSQNTYVIMTQRTLSNFQRVPVSVGQTSCLDQIRIAYDITGTCDLDWMGPSPCFDQDDDAYLTVMTDDWTFNKWS